MAMVGCAAGGALYAISHAGTRADLAAQLQADWMAATLAKMQAGTAIAREQGVRVKGDAPQVKRVMVTGKGQEGKPVHARLAWIVSRGDVFHLAVYADYLADDADDTFFSEIRIQ
jgi:hypothetical protein